MNIIKHAEQTKRLCDRLSNQIETTQTRCELKAKLDGDLERVSLAFEELRLHLFAPTI